MGWQRHLLDRVDPHPSVLSLRDFHAENLIWRGDQDGPDRVGLLDFQDAFVTHPAYDLASLLRDARRDVDPDLTDLMLARFGRKDPAFKMAFHVMAVQRNLRILGIFDTFFSPLVCRRFRNAHGTPNRLAAQTTGTCRG